VYSSTNNELEIEIDLFHYAESIDSAKRVRVKQRKLFPDPDKVIRDVEPLLIKYGFEIVETHKSNREGSSSTYYTTEIVAKSTSSKKLVFIRISDHILDPSNDISHENYLQRKTRSYYRLDDSDDKNLRDLYDFYEITVNGKSYRDYGQALVKIRQDIKSYSDLNIKK